VLTLQLDMVKLMKGGVEGEDQAPLMKGGGEAGEWTSMTSPHLT